MDFRSVNYAIFDLLNAPILPTKFRVNWPFGSRGAKQNRFKRWRKCGNFGFQIGTTLATFSLQVTLILPTKFRFSWPYGSG